MEMEDGGCVTPRRVFCVAVSRHMAACDCTLYAAVGRGRILRVCWLFLGRMRGEWRLWLLSLRYACRLVVWIQ